MAAVVEGIARVDNIDIVDEEYFRGSGRIALLVPLCVFQTVTRLMLTLELYVLGSYRH